MYLDACWVHVKFGPQICEICQTFVKFRPQICQNLSPQVAPGGLLWILAGCMLGACPVLPGCLPDAW